MILVSLIRNENALKHLDEPEGRQNVPVNNYRGSRWDFTPGISGLWKMSPVMTHCDGAELGERGRHCRLTEDVFGLKVAAWRRRMLCIFM